MLSRLLLACFALSAVVLAGCVSVQPVVVLEEPGVSSASLAGASSLRVRTCDFGDEARCVAACAASDAPSCSNLGAMYELGRGVDRDPERAHAFYFTACVQGANGACVNLARMDRAADHARPAPPEPVVVAAAPEPAPAPAAPVEAEAEASAAPHCGDLADCKVKCNHGDAEACDRLPGVHISGNVRIYGNVTMFGDVYVDGQPHRAVASKH